MRKVILFMHVSLDGFVCGPNGEQDWMTLSDHSIGRHLMPDLQKTVDTMLVGRNLFQGFASFWPTVITDTTAPPDLVAFAHWMEDTPKIIFSTTLQEIGWKNATLATRTLPEEIAYLKAQTGGDMVVFGGAGFVAELVKHELIDEYRLKLEPVILGKGKSLFDSNQNRTALTLIQSKAFDSGVVTLTYTVNR